MSHEIIILTPKQKKELKPLFQEVDKAYVKGKKGAIFAQVAENCVRCEFMDCEMTIKIRKVYDDEMMRRRSK